MDNEIVASLRAEKCDRETQHWVSRVWQWFCMWMHTKRSRMVSSKLNNLCEIILKGRIFSETRSIEKNGHLILLFLRKDTDIIWMELVTCHSSKSGRWSNILHKSCHLSLWSYGMENLTRVKLIEQWVISIKILEGKGGDIFEDGAGAKISRSHFDHFE